MLRKAILLIILLAFFAPSLTFAADTPSTGAVDTTEYELLAPVPVPTNAEGKTTAAQYIPAAVKIVIALSGVLAVLMIMFGGLQYMGSESVTSKGDAKKTIQNAFWGLGLVLGAFVILTTINPALLRLDIKLTRFAPPETPAPVVGDEPVITPPGGEGSGEGEGGGAGGSGEGTDGTLPPPSESWRLVPTNAPNPGGKCTYTGTTKDGERYPVCPTNTPTMVDLKVVFPEAGSKCIDPGPCKIHASGLPGMRRFYENAQRYGLEWQIIDAYPPTNDHKNICHQNGGCVDIQSVPISISGFIKLCQVARASRLDYLNESGTTWGNDSGILSACLKNNILQDPDTRYAQLHVFF